jgi:hypothetical protein
LQRSLQNGRQAGSTGLALQQTQVAAVMPLYYKARAPNAHAELTSGTHVARKTGMSRNLMRSTRGASMHRDRASDQPRRRTSALTGHVDYIELAERVAQGVNVVNADPERPAPRSHKPRRTPRR